MKHSSNESGTPDISSMLEGVASLSNAGQQAATEHLGDLIQKMTAMTDTLANLRKMHKEEEPTLENREKQIDELKAFLDQLKGLLPQNKSLDK